MIKKSDLLKQHMFNLRPIHQQFGIELLNFDINQSITQEGIATLNQLIYKYQLILIRNQNISPAEQIKICSYFGQLEPVWDKDNVHKDYPFIQVISNKKHIQTNNKFKGASEYWHMDGTFRTDPSLITNLFVKFIPTFGGDTLFANMYAACDDLSSSLKKQISSLNAIHSYEYIFSKLRRMRGIKEKIINKETISFPDVKRRLISKHPVTGKELLYLNELCIKSIEEMSPLESQNILNQLYQHALQNKYIYRHKWQTGDFIIWDNQSLLHKRANTPNQLRVLYKASTTSKP